MHKKIIYGKISVLKQETKGRKCKLTQKNILKLEK